MQIRALMLMSVLLMATISGCGRDSIASLDVPERLILYSIDGRDFEPGQEPKTEEKFHGYPVLGKIEIQETDKRKGIINALREGLANSDGKMAKCFWPRHALRSIDKGQTIDYVICFECYQLEVHKGSSKSVKPITREPQPLLNKHLNEASIPLTPGMVGDKQRADANLPFILVGRPSQR